MTKKQISMVVQKVLESHLSSLHGLTSAMFEEKVKRRRKVSAAIVGKRILVPVLLSVGYWVDKSDTVWFDCTIVRPAPYSYAYCTKFLVGIKKPTVQSISNALHTLLDEPIRLVRGLSTFDAGTYN